VSHNDQQMAAAPFSNGEFCLGPPSFDQLLNKSSKLVSGIFQVLRNRKVASKPGSRLYFSSIYFASILAKYPLRNIKRTTTY
jgi:hypothetical protein